MTDFATPTMTTNGSIRVPGLKVQLQGLLRGMVATLALCCMAFATFLIACGRALELA